MSDRVFDFNRAAQAKEPLEYFRGLLSHLDAQVSDVNAALHHHSTTDNKEGVYRSILCNDILIHCIMALYPSLPAGQELAPLSRILIEESGGEPAIYQARLESTPYDFVAMVMEYSGSADKFWEYVVQKSTSLQAFAKDERPVGIEEDIARFMPALCDEMKRMRQALLLLTPEYVSRHIAHTSSGHPVPKR